MNLFARRIVMPALIGAVLFLPISGWSDSQSKTPTLILNEDDSHFFGSHSAEQMNLEGLHAFVDQYVDTKVSFTDLGGAAAPPYQCAVGTRCRASPSSRHETTAGNLPQFPHLRLTMPVPEYLLAMKCMAARIGGIQRTAAMRFATNQ